MIAKIRAHRVGILAVAAAIAVSACVILFFSPYHDDAQTAPTPDIFGASSISASAAPDASKSVPLGPPAPAAAPAAGNPGAQSDPFTQEVLRFETTRYMEDSATKNAALAEVATPEYLAENRMPESKAKVSLTVTAVADKSQVYIDDERQAEGKTFRIVSAYAYIEKKDPSGKLVGFLDNLPLHTTTWMLTSSGGWKVSKEGI